MPVACQSRAVTEPQRDGGICRRQMTERGPSAGLDPSVWPFRPASSPGRGAKRLSVLLRGLLFFRSCSLSQILRFAQDDKLKGFRVPPFLNFQFSTFNFQLRGAAAPVLGSPFGGGGRAERSDGEGMPRYVPNFHLSIFNFQLQKGRRCVRLPFCLILLFPQRNRPKVPVSGLPDGRCPCRPPACRPARTPAGRRCPRW